MSSRAPEIDTAALLADPRVTWTQDVLRFCDTDANGHINNAAFAMFCESGRVSLLHDRLRGMREAGGFFVIARVAIEFRAELFYPGVVKCGTWLSAVGRSSVTFAQVLLDGSDRLVATSEAATVALDKGSRRVMPLTDEVRAAIGPVTWAGMRSVA